MLDRVTGILELRDIGFPGAQPKAGKTLDGILRIGEEPFAGRFATAARLDMKQVIEGLQPRINAMLTRALDDTMDLSSAFDSMTVAAVEPVKDGFRLILDLKGALSIAVHAPAKTKTSPEPVRATSAISRPAP